MFIPQKTVSIHSKPYWCPALTTLSNNNNNNNALFIYRLGRISDQSPKNGVDTGHQSGADKYN